MIKPEHLKKGDKVAIVSLCGGLLGEKPFLHKYELAKKRLEEDFGFEVVTMPNALKGIKYLYEHPEARAEDLMNAFKDKSIKAVFNAIGGFDSIRLLPYIDFDVLRDNPKIFTGFSDATSIHFMLNKAGLVSYYGASIMNNFSEYVQINPYTLEAINKTLLNPVPKFEIKNAGIESFEEDKVNWDEKNMNTQRTFYPDKLGYDVWQGKGKFSGELIGGCVEVFIDFIGTKIWPKDFKNKILFLDIFSTDVNLIMSVLRNLNAQGVLNQISGLLIGKISHKGYMEKFKEGILQVIRDEAKLDSLPILYNLNFGHSEPIGIIPLGVSCEVDMDARSVVLLEPATK